MSLVNLGKWALANLFKGLIKAEERLLTSPAGGGVGSSPVTGTSALSRSAGTNSLHISIERPTSPQHRQRALSVISSAPSINIRGIASPAATPAVRAAPALGVEDTCIIGGVKSAAEPAVGMTMPAASSAGTPARSLSGADAGAVAAV